MENIRKILVGIAASVACFALVSDIQGMNEQRRDRPNLHNTKEVDNMCAAIKAVSDDLFKAIKECDGSRHYILKTKGYLHCLIKLLVKELLLNYDAMIPDASRVRLMCDAVRALQTAPYSVVNKGGISVDRTLSDSYPFILAASMVISGMAPNRGQITTDQVNCLLDYILDDDRPMHGFYKPDDSLPNFYNVASMWSANPAIEDLKVDSVIRWHLVRLILDLHEDYGLTCKAVKALAKVLCGLNLLVQAP